MGEIPFDCCCAKNAKQRVLLEKLLLPVTEHDTAGGIAASPGDESKTNDPDSDVDIVVSVEALESKLPDLEQEKPHRELPPRSMEGTEKEDSDEYGDDEFNQTADDVDDVAAKLMRIATEQYQQSEEVHDPKNGRDK